MSVKKIFVQFIPWPLALIYWVVQSNLLIDYVTQSYLFDNLTELPNAEVGLVLGSSKNGKHGINPYFKYRLEAAAELYFSGKVKKLLVSGDNHISTYDETSDMANYLLEAGVPNEDIIRDYAGFRTLDSVVARKKFSIVPR